MTITEEHVREVPENHVSTHCEPSHLNEPRCPHGIFFRSEVACLDAMEAWLRRRASELCTAAVGAVLIAVGVTLAALGGTWILCAAAGTPPRWLTPEGCLFGWLVALAGIVGWAAGRLTRPGADPVRTPRRRVPCPTRPQS